MTIDRGALATILERVPFEAGRWVVAGSAPMLVAGLVESISDVDVVVDDIAWRHARSICDRPPRAGLVGDQVLDLRVGDAVVEVFDGWLGTAAHLILEEAVEIEGHRFSPLARVLDSKRRLLRRKDLDHIVVLEAHLGEGPTGERR